MNLFKRTPSSLESMQPEIIVNEYGGGLSMILPERPVPVYVKPEPMTATEVCALLNYSSPEEIDAARAFGFPAAVGFKQTRHLGGVRRTALYQREAVLAWRERVRVLANL